MNDQGRGPLEIPTPHHLLDGFLAARAGMMPEDVLARDREVIEWFRTLLVNRAEARGRVTSPDELAARREDRGGPVPHELLAAQRVMLEIRKILLVGSPLTKPAPPQESSVRLVLRLLVRWMLNRQLVNQSESRLIDEAARLDAPTPPARRRPYDPAIRRRN